jgi:hypothetical protein
MAGFGDLFGSLGDLLGGLGDLAGENVTETVLGAAFGALGGGGRSRAEYDETATVDRRLAGAPRVLNVNDI